MYFSTKQKLFFGAAALLIVLLLLSFFCVIPGRKGCSPAAQKYELTMWGVFDEDDIWNSLLLGFKGAGGNVTLTYKQIPYADYEKELLNAFAAGRGPDIFMMHHTWLPKFADKITPAPQDEGWLTYSQYRDMFVDVVSDDFTRSRSDIYGIPLYVDTLALFYNRDLFNSAGIAEPPKTWEEFQELIERLTLIDSNGNIVRSGAAMGTARNINRSTDILSLLFLQTFGDTPFVDPEGRSARLTGAIGGAGDPFSPGVEALRFYTDFANPALKSYTWNRDQHYSIDAFIEGSTAMMLNYSHHIETVKNRAPQMSFGIARVPQPKALFDQKRAVDYAGYFGLAVARTNDKRRANAAWSFLQYMMEAPQQLAYHKATLRPPARRDLLSQLANDPDFSVFAQQALTARSWYQPDNVAVETLFADMIESVIDGTAIREALQRAEGEISVLLRKQVMEQRDS